MKQDSPLILFDGVCNFCNGAVNFVLKRDRRKRFRFAALQSKAAEQLLAAHNWPANDRSTFLLIDNGKLYHRSAAALRVCGYLGGLWPLCRVLMIVPRFIRDGLYNWIARHRYQWFGRRDTCRIPTAEERERFEE